MLTQRGKLTFGGEEIKIGGGGVYWGEFFQVGGMSEFWAGGGGDSPSRENPGFAFYCLHDIF